MEEVSYLNDEDVVDDVTMDMDFNIFTHLRR